MGVSWLRFAVLRWRPPVSAALTPSWSRPSPQRSASHRGRGGGEAHGVDGGWLRRCRRMGLRVAETATAGRWVCKRGCLVAPSTPPICPLCSRRLPLGDVLRAGGGRMCPIPCEGGLAVRWRAHARARGASRGAAARWSAGALVEHRGSGCHSPVRRIPPRTAVILQRVGVLTPVGRTGGGLRSPGMLARRIVSIVSLRDCRHLRGRFRRGWVFTLRARWSERGHMRRQAFNGDSRGSQARGKTGSWPVVLLAVEGPTGRATSPQR